MEEENKKPRKVSKTKFSLIIFAVYFFRSFIFLLIPAVIFLIIGIFVKQFLFVGGALLVIDFFMSLVFAIKTVRMKGSHDMFNAILNAAENESEDGTDVISLKPDKEDLYSEKANELRHEASSAKTVREVLELYKKDIADMALDDETYTVYVRKEKYFFDEQMHWVISFDRMREINDDILQHMYMDVLFAPDRLKGNAAKTFECIADSDKEEFFAQVTEHLENNGLMDLEIEDINVGASY